MYLGCDIKLIASVFAGSSGLTSRSPSCSLRVFPIEPNPSTWFHIQWWHLIRGMPARGHLQEHQTCSIASSSHPRTVVPKEQYRLSCITGRGPNESFLNEATGSFSQVSGTALSSGRWAYCYMSTGFVYNSGWALVSGLQFGFFCYCMPMFFH